MDAAENQSPDVRVTGHSFHVLAVLDDGLDDVDIGAIEFFDLLHMVFQEVVDLDRRELGVGWIELKSTR